MFNELGLQKSTIATWLPGAGYRTAMIGKYLNGYTATSSNQPGWDVWNALVGTTEQDQYYRYRLNTNGDTTSFGSAPTDYSTTSWRLAPPSSSGTPRAKTPLFLYFAPTAPHTASHPRPEALDDPRCSGAVNTGYVPGQTGPPPSFNEADLSDKPGWVQEGSPEPPPGRSWIKICRTLLAVDDAVAKIVDALQKPGGSTTR